MPELWTPSDELLLTDPIAAAKVAHPHPALALAAAGVVLPVRTDEENEIVAAAVLAEFDETEEIDGDELVDIDDDGAIDEPTDPAAVDDAL